MHREAIRLCWEKQVNSYTWLYTFSVSSVFSCFWQKCLRKGKATTFYSWLIFTSRSIWLNYLTIGTAMCIKIFCNSDAEVIPGRGHLVGRSTNLKVVIIHKINKRELTKGYDWMMVKKIKVLYFIFFCWEMVGKIGPGFCKENYVFVHEWELLTLNTLTSVFIFSLLRCWQGEFV